MPNKPTTELVAVAWLMGVSGLPTDMIGPNLPADESKWTNGFVQVMTVGGSPNMYIPVRRPVVSIDFWAGNANGNKAPWGKANALAEIVRDACYEDDSARPVEISVGEYDDARVMSVYPLTEPRRVPGDAAGYAHYQMDLQLHWVVA